MVLKTISFPLEMLKIVDNYAYQKNKSRADVVRQAVRDFIKKNGLEETSEIG